MGSKVICPRCEQEGYLVFEKRKKKTTPTIRDAWKKRDQYPELTDKEFAARIVRSKNTIKKDYDDMRRVRHPYARIVHNVKRDGKWTTMSHYLGKITNIDSNLGKLKEIVDPKISDKVWETFKESIDNARYNEFKGLDTPTNQVLAEIIVLRKIPYTRLHKNTEKEHHCPHCNKSINLVMDGSRISLKELDELKSF